MQRYTKFKIFCAFVPVIGLALTVLGMLLYGFEIIGSIILGIIVIIGIIAIIAGSMLLGLFFRDFLERIAYCIISVIVGTALIALGGVLLGILAPTGFFMVLCYISIALGVILDFSALINSRHLKN